MHNVVSDTKRQKLPIDYSIPLTSEDFRLTEFNGILLPNLYKYEILVFLNTDIISKNFHFHFSGI